jgi:hypothetical protein
MTPAVEDKAQVVIQDLLQYLVPRPRKVDTVLKNLNPDVSHFAFHRLTPI